MTWALFCGDAACLRSVNSYATATAAARAEYPLADGMPDEITSCAFWSRAPAEPAVTITSAGQRDILILQNKRDNAASTPAPWAYTRHSAHGPASSAWTTAAITSTTSLHLRRPNR